MLNNCLKNFCAGNQFFDALLYDRFCVKMETIANKSVCDLANGIWNAANGARDHVDLQLNMMWATSKIHFGCIFVRIFACLT